MQSRSLFVLVLTTKELKISINRIRFIKPFCSNANTVNMCPEHTKLYTECEHAITESYELTESTDLSSTQEIVRGRCPNCPDPPRSLMESSIEPLPTAPIVSYVRSLKGKAQRIVRSLRSTSSDDANTKEDRRSAQTVSMTSSTNMDDEIVGKENIGARNSLADRTKVIVTGAISNTMAAKQ
jgi:hypothetical protein